MAKEKFTRKQFLGEGYFHYFRDKKGGVVVEECSKEDYDRLGLPGGSQFNPSREGLVWEYSAGGVVKVDNPDFQLREGDYVEYGDKALFVKDGIVRRVRKSDVVLDEIDSAKWL